MDDSCIVVFTSRSVEQMLAEGGSQAWKLGSMARRQKYLVCAWNAAGEYARPVEGVDHREGFLVSPIAAIEPAAPPEDAGRSIIRFTEFAKISLPNVWSGQRNPITYSSLARLGIDVATLEFTSARGDESGPPSAPSRALAIRPLTIPLAKQGLALHYGVDPQTIEITIRG